MGGGNGSPAQVGADETIEDFRSNVGQEAANPVPALTWDDDEVETQIWDGYDEPPDDPLAALAGKAKPAFKPSLPGPPGEVLAPMPSPKE